MIKTVYVSGPYSKGDVVVNVRNAVMAAEKIAEAGGFPFIPHLSHLWHTIAPHDWEFWLRQDLEWVERCDVFFRMSGESNGAALEEKCARELGKPIYLETDSLERLCQDIRTSS